MSRTVRCPACPATLAVPAEAPGKLRCPKCGTVVTVPREEIAVARVAAPPARRGRKLGLVVGWAGALALFGFCCVPSLVSVFRGAGGRGTDREPAKAPPGPDIDKLVAELRSDNPGAREKAAKRLAGVKDLPREAVAALLDVWKGGTYLLDKDQSAALGALRKVGPSGYEQFSKIAKDTSEPVRRRAFALSALALMGAVLKEKASVRAAFGDPGPLLEDATECGGVPLWLSAASVLVETDPDDKRVLPLLMRGLDYNESSREVAILALGDLKGRARPALPMLRRIATGDLPYTAQKGATSPESLKLQRLPLAEVIKAIETDP
jgi:phage FluMu protein Com